ncbi:MAG: AraC family transcriptional regulator [Chitinophagaceae bacterium]
MVNFSRDDIKHVMEIEAVLLRGVFQAAPMIPQLAKMVNINSTRIKNNFKTVYGLPSYQYFQKARICAARDVLQTSNYSAKHVTMEPGYTNLHYFNVCFKKEFGLLKSRLNDDS